MVANVSLGIEKKTLDSHISFVRHRRWKLLMDGLLAY